MIRDITDHSLRHLQGFFIDTAAHELQTPLAALRGYLALVDRGAGDTLDAKTRAYLDGAVEQSRLLVELAARLFDVSVIRHGRSVVTLTPVDLGSVVEESVAQARMAAPDRPIDVILPRTTMVVDGDPMRLRQLIGNLLANAQTHGASDESGVPVQVSLGDAVAMSWSRSRTADPASRRKSSRSCSLRSRRARRPHAEAWVSACSWPRRTRSSTAGRSSWTPATAAGPRPG